MLVFRASQRHDAGAMGELYSQYEYWIAAAQLLLAMLGMGATLRVRDFAEVARAPWPITVGCLLQVVGVPLIAWAFLSTLSLDPGIAIGPVSYTHLTLPTIA